MINGFEKETHELTEFEMNVVNAVVPKLKMNIGKDKVVKNREIISALKKMGYKVSPARLRKVIHHIRVNQLVVNLVSTSNGYYVATKKEEVIKYVESLQQRINSIEELKNSFKIS